MNRSFLITPHLSYSDTKTVHHDMAGLFTNFERMDNEVGEIMDTPKPDTLSKSSHNPIAEGIYKVSLKKTLNNGEHCFVFETDMRNIFDFSIQNK